MAGRAGAWRGVSKPGQGSAKGPSSRRAHVGAIHIARGLEKLAGLFLLGCGVKLTLN
jgi:hypothetical protein